MTAYEIYNTFNKLDRPEYYEIAIQNNVGNIDGACEIIQNCFNCNKETAEEVIKIMNKTVEDSLRSKGIEPLSMQQKAHNQSVARETSNKPKCPTCSSTNLKKISSTSKVINTAVFGFFGTKRHKIFHCNNCGYEW